MMMIGSIIQSDKNSRYNSKKKKVGKKKYNFIVILWEYLLIRHVHSRRLGIVVAHNLNSFLTKVLNYHTQKIICKFGNMSAFF